jgi:hypothetical protein
VTIWDDEFHFAVWCWCGAGSLCLFDARTEAFARAGGAVTRKGDRVCFTCAADLARRESLPDQYGRYWADPWTEEAYRGWIRWLPNFPRALAVWDPTDDGAHWYELHHRLPATSSVPPWEQGVQPARTWSSVPPWEERAQPAAPAAARDTSSNVPHGEQGAQPAAPAAPPREAQSSAAPAEPAALSAAETQEQRLQELELQVSKLRVRLLQLEHFNGFGH